MAYKINRRSLLSSDARIQVPWVKVTLKSDTNTFTFGVFTRETKREATNKERYLENTYYIQYPNYVKKLQITKINGQVNQYVLNINYPITQNDDPNFFEKIFSSVSKTRKVIFTYGDAANPTYVYMEEEAIITTIQQSFNLESSSISYTINAVSSSSLATSANESFPKYTNKKPSDIIKQVFKDYKLQKTFTGMNNKNLSTLIAGDDAAVTIEAKTNISVLDYITFLASCMYEQSNTSTTNPQNIYVMTMHDNTTYDQMYDGYDNTINGPYFKISKVSYKTEKSDAYEIDIGYNTSTIVTQFSLENNENYAIYYEYQDELNADKYVKRINSKGQWEDIYAPTLLSKNADHRARSSDKSWWTKITQFPINANITVQGLLRPAQLLTYVRLNVIFPGGHKHISSGLYIITKQVDTIDDNGYKTQLAMTKVGGALLDQDENGRSTLY